MWPFKKKQPKLPIPKKYPDRNDDLVAWMESWIAYYEQEGFDPSNFFNPCHAEYFPGMIHVGSYYIRGYPDYDDSKQKIYCAFKRGPAKKYWDKAQANFSDLAYRCGHYTIGDWDDVPEKYR